MKVKLSRGATINLGNYQSYRFDVGIEEDFAKEIPLKDSYERISAEVNILFEKEMKEAKRQAI